MSFQVLYHQKATINIYKSTSTIVSGKQDIPKTEHIVRSDTLFGTHKREFVHSKTGIVKRRNRWVIRRALGSISNNVRKDQAEAHP